HDNHRVFTHRATFNHRDAFQRSNSTAASVDSAERGLSARANAERIPSGVGGGNGERSLVVPENLAGNFQQHGPSIVGLNYQRAVSWDAESCRSEHSGNSRIHCAPSTTRYAPRRL